MRSRGKAAIRIRGRTSIWSAMARCRFRMCAGLMLRRHASKVGYVLISGKKNHGTRREKAKGRKAT
jgi:hypothetical protein